MSDLKFQLGDLASWIPRDDDTPIAVEIIGILSEQEIEKFTMTSHFCFNKEANYYRIRKLDGGALRIAEERQLLGNKKI